MNVAKPLPLNLAFSNAKMNFSKSLIGITFPESADSIEAPVPDSNIWKSGFDLETRTPQEVLDGIKQLGAQTREQFQNIDENDEGRLTYSFSAGELRDGRIVTDEFSLDDPDSVVSDSFRLSFRDHQLELGFSSVNGAMVRSGFLMIVPDDMLKTATEIPASEGLQPAMRALLAHVLGVEPESVSFKEGFGGSVIASHHRGLLSAIVLSAERRPGGKKVLALRFQGKDNQWFVADSRVHSLFSELSGRQDELKVFLRAREEGSV